MAGGTPGRRLRVAHIHDRLTTGGVERYLLDLATRHDPSRFELVLFCTGEPGPLEPDVVDAGMAVRYVAGVADLVEALRSFDIAHAHVGGGGRYIGNIAACKAQVPIKIETYHWPIATEDEDLDAVICPSEICLRVHQEAGHLAPTVDIPIGIDLERFSPRPRDPDRPLTVGRVSRLVYEKDPFTFLKAAGRVHAIRPDIRFLVAGDGPLLEPLSEAARNLPVEFLGNCSDVPGVLARMDLFAYSSLGDSFAIVVAEAAAMGLPIVTTPQGNLGGAVDEGRNGFMVPEQDDREMADAILALLDDPAILEAFGRASREIAEQRFDVARMVAAHEALYLSLAAQKGLPVPSG